MIEVLETSPINVIELIGDSRLPDIEKIEEVGIDIADFKFVGQGKITEPNTSKAPRFYGAEDFGPCSALILRGQLEGDWTFAHVHPLDDPVYSKLLSRRATYRDALLISGTQASSQYDFAAILRPAGVTVKQLKVDTGSTPFSVAFDTETRTASVVRSKPTRAILQFTLFSD